MAGRCGLLSAFVLLTQGGAAERIAPQVHRSRSERQTHVTRLHRNDHTGREAIEAAEARWHAGEAPSSSEERFLRLSAAQLEWLHAHHTQAALVQMASTASVGLVQGHRLRASASAGVFARHAAQADTSSELPTTMLSSLDSQYVGPIGIGTVSRPEGCSSAKLEYLPHAQAALLETTKSQTCHAEEQSEVFVVFDTGSTNLWVASDLCNSGGCAQSDRARYNHSLSQTYSEPETAVDLHVQFGTGSLNGPVGVDDLHVGPFTVYNQSFGLIKTAEGAVFESIPLEGILGLAFPSMAAKGSSPFFDTIIKQKALKNNKFAFYFSLSNPAANAIFWGDVDKDFHSGDISYHKVTDPYYWGVDLLSFQIGGKELLGDGQHQKNSQQKVGTSLLQEEAEEEEHKVPKAIVDTGTTFFTAGGELYHKIMEALPAAQCDALNETSHPTILFRLQNTEGEVTDYKLDNSQYMAESNNYCSPAFMNIDIPSKHGPGMILGEVFLRHYLAVFDRGDGGEESGRVGFAKSVHGEHVDNRLKDLTHNQATFAQARHRDQASKKRQ